jgi:micrococcal nuclease
MKVMALPLLIAAAALPTKGKCDEGLFSGPYFGEVIRVIDGDTLEAKVELWPTISATVSVRLKGVDAPELTRPECAPEALGAKAAKEAMDEVLQPGTRIRLEAVEEDSFSGRVVADAFRQGDERGRTLVELLKRRGAICPWKPGQPDIDWCSDTSDCWSNED